jgi:HEPN domain-containing protein
VVKKFTRAQGFSEKDLLHSAMDHMASSQVLLGIGYHGLDSAGYLAHLTMEIFLKAFLLHRDDEFPETHKLENLINRCLSDDFKFTLDQESAELLKKLDRFNDLRYPDPDDPVSVSTEELESLPRVATAVLANFPDSLINELDHLDDPQPDGTFVKGGRVFMIKPKEDIPMGYRRHYRKFLSRLLQFTSLGAVVGGVFGGIAGLFIMWWLHHPPTVAVFVTVVFAITGAISSVFRAWDVIEKGSRVRNST